MSSTSSQMKEYIEPGSCAVLVRRSIESKEEIPNAIPPSPVLKATTPANPVIAPQQLDDDGINAIPAHAAAASGAPFVAQSVEVVTAADAIVNARAAGPGNLYNLAWTHDNGIRSGALSSETAQPAIRPNSPSQGEKEDISPPACDAPYYPPRNSSTLNAWERFPSDEALRQDVQRRWNEQERAAYPRFVIHIEEIEPTRQNTPVNPAAAVADGGDRDIGGLWNEWGHVLADMAAHHQAMFGVDEQGINDQLPSTPGSVDGSEEGGVVGLAAPAAAQLPPPRTAFEDLERSDVPKPNITFSTMNFDDSSSTTLGKPKSSLASKIAPIIAFIVALGLIGLVITMMAMGKLMVGAGITIVALLLVCGAVKYFYHVLYSFGCRNRWVLAKRQRHIGNDKPG